MVLTDTTTLEIGISIYSPLYENSGVHQANTKIILILI